MPDSLILAAAIALLSYGVTEAIARFEQATLRRRIIRRLEAK